MIKHLFLITLCLFSMIARAVSINVRNPTKGTLFLIRIFDESGNKVPIAENVEQLKNIGCQPKKKQVTNGCIDCCMLFGSQEEMANWLESSEQQGSFRRSINASGIITLNITLPFAKIELEQYKIAKQGSIRVDNTNWANFDIKEKIKTHAYTVPTNNTKNIELKFPEEPTITDETNLLLWPTQ